MSARLFTAIALFCLICSCPVALAALNAGPTITYEERDLAQDGFPAISPVDLVDLGRNSVRFDMAANISPAEDMNHDPGDSIVLMITPRPGAVLVGLPRLHYKLRANPLFDAYRTSGLPNTGSVLSLGALGSDPTRFAFDLPDSGFLFPGDALHYYVTATDELDGDALTSVAPADTTEFGDFAHGALSYVPSFFIRALPSVFDDGAGNPALPEVLYWNDNGNRGSLEEWAWAFHHQGFTVGRDYDVYYTNEPTGNVGNGLGERASLAQIESYQVIVYSSGTIDATTLGNGDNGFWVNPANDLALLRQWLDLGERDFLLSGSGVASDLADGGQAEAEFLCDYLGLEVISDDIAGLIDDQSVPTVAVLPGNPVFQNVSNWWAYEGPRAGGPVDAVVACAGANTEPLAGFLNPEGLGGTYPYAAAMLNRLDNNSRVVSLPYDLAEIWTAHDDTKVAAPLATRTLALKDVLFFFGIDWPHLLSLTDVPEGSGLATSPYPNPFNPTTRISYDLPHSGHLSLKVYDLKGQLIRTLRDERIAAGPGHATWDGRNHQGAQVSSGLYFYQARLDNKIQTGKMTLLK